MRVIREVVVSHYQKTKDDKMSPNKLLKSLLLANYVLDKQRKVKVINMRNFE